MLDIGSSLSDTRGFPKRISMAKNKNTFEKRRKEMERMRKAQEKRERRLARKSSSVDAESPDGVPTVLDPEQSDTQAEASPQM